MFTVICLYCLTVERRIILKGFIRMCQIFCVSGKKENPLSLLSQYSDEDSDEEQIDRSSDDTREGTVPNGQVVIILFLFQNLLCCYFSIDQII
jgi:hypothetical protein